MRFVRWSARTPGRSAGPARGPARRARSRARPGRTRETGILSHSLFSPAEGAPRLAQQLAPRPGDRHIDAHPALPLVLRAVDVHAPEIELADVADRRQDLLERGLGARALQLLHRDLGDDEALERRKRERLVGGV